MGKFSSKTLVLFFFMLLWGIYYQTVYIFQTLLWKDGGKKVFLTLQRSNKNAQAQFFLLLHVTFNARGLWDLTMVPWERSVWMPQNPLSHVNWVYGEAKNVNIFWEMLHIATKWSWNKRTDTYNNSMKFIQPSQQKLAKCYVSIDPFISQ